MKKHLAILTMALMLPAAATAQGNSRGRGNSDHQRQRSEQSRRDDDQQQAREAQARRERVRDAWIPPRPVIYRPQRDMRDDRRRVYEAPRVHRDGNRWVEPVYSRDDFRWSASWEYRRFTRGIGPDYVWQLRGGSRSRFNVSGVYFTLLRADYPWAYDWDWDRDYIVIYLDPDHYGWYLAYNVRLGMYLHVRYLGYY